MPIVTLVWRSDGLDRRVIDRSGLGSVARPRAWLCGPPAGTRTAVLLLFLLTAMLAPSADADSAARGFAKVSIQARERLTGVRETETDPATSIRAALKA